MVSEFKRGDKVLDSDGHPSFYCKPALTIGGGTDGYYVNSNSKLNPNQDRWTKSVTKENNVEFKNGEKVLGTSLKEDYYYVGKNPENEGQHILVDKSGEPFRTDIVIRPPRALNGGDNVFVSDEPITSYNTKRIFHGMFNGHFVCSTNGKLSGAELWEYAIHIDDKGE